MKRMSSKKWVFITVAVTWIVFICCIILVVTIDPYLHYRIPDNGLRYSLTSGRQRYLNDGIIRHFEYDAVITGTSMTENFKTTELDKVWGGVNSIKVPFAGGHYKEINDTCKRIFEVCPNVKMIVRGLDLSLLVEDKDSSRYDNFPDYLYNDKVIDDINYWLNKMTILEGCVQNVFFHSVLTKDEGNFWGTFSFDEYSRWQEYFNFGKEYVLSSYVRPEKSESITKMTKKEKEMVLENVRQNVTELADEHPETRFLLFFTPYSICYWDSLEREGKLEWEIEAQKIAIEEILKSDNIELYSFCNNFEMVTDLNNYKDIAHYSGDVNSRMLVWMKKGDYRLTWDNYEDYLQEINEFYSMYDYEDVFK